jgi:hypothetical protein
MPEVVAGTAILLTAHGPAPAAELVAGKDQLWVVTHHGALALADLLSISDPLPTRLWRLLTAVGEIALPEGAYVSTDGGRFLGGDEVEDLLRRGADVDVDVISPSDVEFSTGSSDRGRAHVVRNVLAVLPHGTVQIPVANGAAKAVEPAVKAMLKAASVPYRRTCDDRWLAFALRDLPQPPAIARRGFGKQADALLLATAWEPAGDGVASRIRLRDAPLLQRLIAALVGAGRAFEVKWTPKYSPVECRVRVLEEAPWGAFATVDAATPATGSAYQLKLRGSGRPIVALGVTTSQL